jgi:Tat protein translocase TatB subunit
VFNIGGGEIIVIGLLALIVLGPSRLPAAARKAGEVLGDLRRISSGFQADIRNALQDAERDAAAADAETVVPPPVAEPALPQPVTALGVAVSEVSAQAAPPADTAAPAKEATAKKATPAKEATAKRAKKATPAKKATAKKATAKKATAKKATAKKAPAKKAPAKKAAAKKRTS